MNSIKSHKKTANTRLAMINAAIEIFGRDGYHGANNRELAKKAGVNLALISYHFGGKEGLYLAVFEHIAAQIKLRLEPLTAQLQLDLLSLSNVDVDDNNAKDQSLKIIESLLFAYIELLATEQTAVWIKLILAEQQAPSPAFAILYRGPISHLLQLLSQPVAFYLQKNPDHMMVKLTTLNLIGQIQIFRSFRQTVLQHTGWQDIKADELDLIKQQISLNVQALLAGLSIAK